MRQIRRFKLNVHSIYTRISGKGNKKSSHSASKEQLRWNLHLILNDTPHPITPQKRKNTISDFRMWPSRLVLMCITRHLPLSSKTNTADELCKHLSGPQIFFCRRTTLESAGQCLHRGYAAVCTHTLRSIAAGSPYSKHGLQLPETHYNRKTVAANQQKCDCYYSLFC